MRIVAQGKSSLAPEGESIAFELSKENGFRFVGKYDISADELLSGNQKDNKSQLAEQLLNEMLSEGKRTLDKVKKNMYIKSVKENNKWYWELMKDE